MSVVSFMNTCFKLRSNLFLLLASHRSLGLFFYFKKINYVLKILHTNNTYFPDTEYFFFVKFMFKIINGTVIWSRLIREGNYYWCGGLVPRHSTYCFSFIISLKSVCLFISFSCWISQAFPYSTQKKPTYSCMCLWDCDSKVSAAVNLVLQKQGSKYPRSYRIPYLYVNFVCRTPSIEIISYQDISLGWES